MDALPKCATFPVNTMEGRQAGWEQPPPRAQTPQCVCLATDACAVHWALPRSVGHIHGGDFYQGGRLSLPWPLAPKSGRFSIKDRTGLPQIILISQSNQEAAVTRHPSPLTPNTQARHPSAPFRPSASLAGLGNGGEALPLPKPPLGPERGPCEEWSEGSG